MQILERLASGAIDTAEAARLIDAQASSGGEPTPGAEPLVGEVLDAGVSDAGAPEGTEVLRRARADDDAAGLGRPQFATFLRDAVRRATAGPRPGVPQVSRIAVRAVGRRVRVVADPGVSTVNVTGPHLLRRSGDVIEVTSDGDIGPSLDGFSLVRPPHTLEDLRTMSLGKQLVVRVNPAVVVDAEVTGGSLRISGVPALGRLRVSAGSMKCTDVAGIEDCLVQMGSATIVGCFVQGRSRVRAESGSVMVRLDPASQVSVRAEAQMGGVSWPGDQAYDEFTLGIGSARLDLAVVMGHISVRVQLTEQEQAAADEARRLAKAANEAARAQARQARQEARAAREAARQARDAARQRPATDAPDVGPDPEPPQPARDEDATAVPDEPSPAPGSPWFGEQSFSQHGWDGMSAPTDGDEAGSGC